MAIRDQGFGLNFNRGFGSGKAFFGAGGDPELQRIGLGGYEQRLGNQQQNDAAAQRQARQFGQDQALLNLQLGQQERGSQRDFELGRAGLANQAAIARLQAEASQTPYRLQQQRFETVFPYLRDALGGGDFQSGYTGQGQVGTQPEINADNIYSDQQIQQQVNSQRASNDAATAGAQRRIGQQMAARGYGTNSPLAMELGLGLQNQNLAQNTANERDLRYQAAQGNAQQKLSAQTAREGQFASRQQEDIERNRIQSGRYNALLSALSGLV